MYLAGVAVYLAYGIRHSREHEVQQNSMSEEQRILIPVGSDSLFTDAVSETASVRPIRPKLLHDAVSRDSIATALRV
jgi:hypothetical protein